MNKLTFQTFAMALLIFVGGVVVGNMTAGNDGGMLTTSANRTTNSDEVNTASTPETQAAADNVASGNGSAVAFTFSIADLPDTQKAFLRTMGIEGDSISVTNDMLVCAEVAVGAERITAIKNGEAPSMSEGVKLAGCYE